MMMNLSLVELELIHDALCFVSNKRNRFMKFLNKRGANYLDEDQQLKNNFGILIGKIFEEYNSRMSS